MGLYDTIYLINLLNKSKGLDNPKRVEFDTVIDLFPNNPFIIH